MIVNYGSSWCAHCHELFSHFYDLAKKVSCPSLASHPAPPTANYTRLAQQLFAVVSANL